MSVGRLEAHLVAGREALSRGEWQEARAAFEEATAADGTPEAFEGLAEACWWQHDEAGTFAAREKAYHLYRSAGDNRSAARMATWLATDSIEFRGQPAVANGWFQRAHRLLKGLEETPEHGWLTLWEANLALMMQNDTVTARQQGAEAAAAGRALGLTDLEMLALALEGLALVCEGEITDGMKRLDEAATAAMAGEMMDLNAMGTAFCFLIDACDRVRDFDRASQWCSRAQAFFQERRCPELFTFCRPHYAVVLMWRGRWEEAEAQLLAANRDAPLVRPPMAVEGIVRLAELRWRQGRWEEADELFAQVKNEGLAQLGMAELALSRGDSAAALDLTERYLRRIPSEDRIERAGGLELFVRALIAAGAASRARASLDELRQIAARAGTEPLHASAALARGMLAAADGDHDAARADLEDAADLFERQGAPFETSRARLELAKSLAALGRHVAAGEGAAMALQAFRRVGAAAEAEAAARFLGVLGGEQAALAAPSNPAGLSGREVDVLRLIATGRSNHEIAEELFLSVRTVERHISTIYEKIGAHGKAARAAATAYALRHGLAAKDAIPR